MTDLNTFLDLADEDLGKAKVSYSQFGEDIQIMAIMQIHGRLNRPGFFVDVGAHHPTISSNTHLLSRFHGWTGVNVEPNPERMSAFHEGRTQDVNLATAVTSKAGSVKYHRFDHPGVNTIDVSTSERMQQDVIYKLQDVIDVPTLTLAEIMETHAPKDRQVDLLNVDVEGAEMEVLTSNDWTRFRPFVLCIEDHELRLDAPQESESYRYLRGLGYTLGGMAIVSAIYVNV
jgi:FkbM family methyltransferase